MVSVFNYQYSKFIDRFISICRHSTIILFLLFDLFLIRSFSQNIANLEQKYSHQEDSLKETRIELDSLDQILDIKANIIAFGIYELDGPSEVIDTSTSTMGKSRKVSTT